MINLRNTDKHTFNTRRNFEYTRDEIDALTTVLNCGGHC